MSRPLCCSPVTRPPLLLPPGGCVLSWSAHGASAPSGSPCVLIVPSIRLEQRNDLTRDRSIGLDTRQCVINKAEECPFGRAKGPEATVAALASGLPFRRRLHRLRPRTLHTPADVKGPPRSRLPTPLDGRSDAPSTSGRPAPRWGRRLPRVLRPGGTASPESAPPPRPAPVDARSAPPAPHGVGERAGHLDRSCAGGGRYTVEKFFSRFPILPDRRW